MEDQTCSPEKYSVKNSYNKNILFEWKKYTYDKDVSWIQIYFDWMKIYFNIMKKRWYNENIFY